MANTDGVTFYKMLAHTSYFSCIVGALTNIQSHIQKHTDPKQLPVCHTNVSPFLNRTHSCQSLSHR